MNERNHAQLLRLAPILIELRGAQIVVANASRSVHYLVAKILRATLHLGKSQAQILER